MAVTSSQDVRPKKDDSPLDIPDFEADKTGSGHLVRSQHVVEVICARIDLHSHSIRLCWCSWESLHERV